jgi:hypothetical protein
MQHCKMNVKFIHKFVIINKQRYYFQLCVIYLLLYVRIMKELPENDALASKYLGAL